MVVQPNKAIVGANAFAHEAGIHQDGVLKHAATYEIMSPESVGVVSNLVLGKHSGKAAFKARLEDLGYTEYVEDPEALEDVFKRFKVLADAKKTISDADLDALLTDEMTKPEDIWRLQSCHVFCGTDATATATISLVGPEGEVVKDAALGQGPIEAIYKSISRVTNLDIGLTDLQVKSVTEGRDAMGMVSVRVKNLADTNDEMYHGSSTDIDTVQAAAQAFVHAINRMLTASKRTVVPPGRVTLNPSIQKVDAKQRNSLMMA
jgi:2-isopropylmalate synthase